MQMGSYVLNQNQLFRKCIINEDFSYFFHYYNKVIITGKKAFCISGLAYATKLPKLRFENYVCLFYGYFVGKNNILSIRESKNIYSEIPYKY